METIVYDFLIVVGNNLDEELGTYRLFNVMSDPRVKNRRIMFQL